MRLIDNAVSCPVNWVPIEVGSAHKQLMNYIIQASNMAIQNEPVPFQFYKCNASNMAIQNEPVASSPLSVLGDKGISMWDSIAECH